MALSNFKEISNRIGYLVNQKDRYIFQKEVSKSNFGLGYFDFIEFILYDSSDNQLPQASVNGEYVRYLFLDDPNIRKYFIISNPKKNVDNLEYVIDLETLIKEAGYSNGIFKTQTTLLNRRVGFENSPNNKLWIEEISPSRTEIRLLPVRNPEVLDDLEKRYDILVNCKNFRDDTIYYVKELIENIDFQKILKRIYSEAGDNDDGIQFLNLIKNEFKIDDFEIFIEKIRAKILEATLNFYNGRGYRIRQLDYGQPISGVDKVELSIDSIIKNIDTITFDVLDYFLMERDLDRNNKYRIENQTTIDTLAEILKTTSSWNTYGAKLVGCTDINADNYNPDSIEDDGSCIYEDGEVAGCMDPNASNYNELANIDDGSCKYGSSTTKTFYIWSDVGSIKYKDSNGNIKTTGGKEYDSITITYIGSPEFTGDVRDVPKKIDSTKLIKYRIRFSPKYIDASIPDFAYFSYTNSNGDNINQRLELGESITICLVDGTLSASGLFQRVALGECE